MEEALGSSLPKRWIVARTKTMRERWAEENLQRLGFQTYLPVVLERCTRHGRRIACIQPLFPSYCFVACAGQWRIILSCFGVVGLILRGSEPDSIPKRAIEELRAREQDGIVELPKPPPTIEVGTAVTVSKGPFKGHAGLVSGLKPHQRIEVLLDFMSRRVSTLIAVADVSIAA